MSRPARGSRARGKGAQAAGGSQDCCTTTAAGCAGVQAHDADDGQRSHGPWREAQGLDSGQPRVPHPGSIAPMHAPRDKNSVSMSASATWPLASAAAKGYGVAWPQVGAGSGLARQRHTRRRSGLSTCRASHHKAGSRPANGHPSYIPTPTGMPLHTYPLHHPPVPPTPPPLGRQSQLPSHLHHHTQPPPTCLRQPLQLVHHPLRAAAKHGHGGGQVGAVEPGGYGPPAHLQVWLAKHWWGSMGLTHVLQLHCWGAVGGAACTLRTSSLPPAPAMSGQAACWLAGWLAGTQARRLAGSQCQGRDPPSKSQGPPGSSPCP